MEMFEKASREKLRFRTASGLLTAEDLWDLPLTSRTKTSLDSIAVSLDSELEGKRKSFVNQATSDAATQLAFDIVKHVIDVRMKENAERLAENERRQQREQIQSLIARKESESLESLSLDELRELAKNL